MNLATLPDDELLQVLRFLGNRELLRCRGVCRRLRDAALHPHLWRKRQLWVSRYKDVELCAAVLRLAPCLGALDVDNWKNTKEYLRLGTLLATTNCAISKLRVAFSSEFACLFPVMLIARQATLGRLTSVSLSAGEMSSTAEFQLVLDLLLYTQGLTSIVVIARDSEQVPLGLSLPKAAKSDAVPASLRNLQYYVNDGPRLLSYLQWHADTLQVLILDQCEVPAGTATLIGSLPRLQELHCDMMDNMEALLQCSSLKTLYLCVRANDSTRKFLPGAQQFLRHAVADRLEKLTFNYEEERDVEPRNTASFDSAVDLVRCLAGPSSSAPSALRSLHLHYKTYEDETDRPQPQLRPLAAVLHRLDNLENLELNAPSSDDFLAALDGRVLPRLEHLRFSVISKICGCPHEWAHGPKPRALVHRYPQLHLDLETIHLRCHEDCDDDDCEDCMCVYCLENSCHAYQSGGFILFSHPEHEVCNHLHFYSGIRIDL